MKISIRLSIFSILLLLLFGVSFFIIGVTYYNLNAVFVTSAKDYLSMAGAKTSEQIAGYLDPLNDRSAIAAELISTNTISPKNSNKFFIFLHDLTIGTKGIQTAKWADVSGNYFRLAKEANDKFLGEIIISKQTDANRITINFNAQMQPLDTKVTSIDYDPLIMPWFQIVRFKKNSIWFISPILNPNTNTTKLEINSAQPIFNKDNTLRGVFALEMPITTITEYVKQIKVTANSVVFITDNLGNLITYFASDIDLTNRTDMPKIKDIKMPWVEQAYNLYSKTQQPTFEFRYSHNNYIAAFNAINAPRGERKWVLGVVTPIHDIIAPLQRSTLISLFVVLLGLLGGVVFSNLVASSISKPINKLAQDSELICKLELTKITAIYSHIKEVTHMGTAFIKMKNVLQSFQRYIPTSLVKKLVTTGKVAEIGGETKELTIIYTGIEHFTPLSESMLPTELMTYLSEYFQVIAKIVIDNFGTIDKYLGDGVMAFWGAPQVDAQHAAHACQTVLQVKAALEELNAKWQRENKPKIATHIGINSGKVVIGNIGSDDRLSYTAIGDAVNLTSRLENLNKLYGTDTLISEFTYNEVKDNFNCRLIDKVAVKGKKQEILVYELLTLKTADQNIKLEQYNTMFATAFNYYTLGKWTNARLLFSELAQQYPEDHLLKIFIKRCTDFQQQPPQAWTGAWIISEKL